MITGIIYKYTSPSGKAYIGQTTNEQIRREHWNTEGPYAGRKINRARKKYGLKNFTYEVLIRKEYSSAEEAKVDLDTLEIYYIGLYDSYRHGYNCTIGGNTTLGYKHSKKTRKILSIIKIGKRASKETRNKLSRIRKGKKHSKEGRMNISKALKGRKCTWAPKISEAKSRAILQYSINGIYIREYKSTKEASSITSIGIHSIYKCLSGKNNTAGGFIWKYKN